MVTQSLQRRHSPLADPLVQLQVLEPAGPTTCPAFEATLSDHGLPPLVAGPLRTLQINVGKLCNQTCAHCHVDAGPERREVMSRETLQDCLDLLDRTTIETVDVTGGAPEMNPHFRWFITELRRRRRHVIDRCNLTILSAPGYTDLPEFLAAQQVEVVASLPCYLEENCDRQRGAGVFDKSIAGLQRLNEAGYARPGTGLSLCLVYNPVGPSLPPDQARLEAAYRAQLRSRFGIEFTRLYTITNLPISRFLDDLLATGRYEAYLDQLVQAFNPQTVDDLMCRSTLSVDWRGRLFDCDFNQMLDLPAEATIGGHVREFDLQRYSGRRIRTARHCYGCTAGAGSSCQGALVDAATAATVS